MTIKVIHDWTDCVVPLRSGQCRNLRYRVYRDGNRVFQEIRDADGAPLHTLELPHGMVLDTRSYEVLLRYVLVDVVAA